jgi:ABC-type multidrug transport system fused ATPase/permease subunit
MTTVGALRRLLEAMDLRARSLALVALASTVPAMLIAPVPFLVQRAFSLAVNGGSRVALAASIGGLVALLVGTEAIAALVRRAALRLTKPGTERLRGRVATAIADLPVDLVEPQSPYVHDVYVHDTERVDGMLSAAVGQMLPAVMVIAGLATALAIARPGFGLATLVAAAAIAGAERLTRHRVRRRLDESHQAFREFSRGAWSMLSGVLVTRSHAGERTDTSARAAEARAASRTSEAAGHAATTAMFVGRATAAIVFGGLLLAAGLLVQGGAMSIPVMLAVTSTIALLRGPLFALGQIAPQLQAGWRAWGRVSALLDAAAGGAAEGAPLPEDTTLTLDAVGCRWGRTPIFDDVSFSLGPGEIVAITGPNGAGKTTLVRQILGLTAPTAGTIRVGGVPLDRLDLAAWRRAVGVVLQETWFFDGSVLENLTYGAPSATMACVQEACRIARADELVYALPQGLDTRIGGEGLPLSQGQRQRLAIARALARRPRLLILDEPTNHLDEPTAQGILQDLVAAPDRPAILLITHVHRFAAMAGRVYRLAAGHLTRVDHIPEAAAEPAPLVIAAPR